MQLIKQMKRGPDKTLSYDPWLSASMDPETHECIRVRIHFPEGDHIARYVVELTAEQAINFRDHLIRRFPLTKT